MLLVGIESRENAAENKKAKLALRLCGVIIGCME